MSVVAVLKANISVKPSSNSVMNKRTNEERSEATAAAALADGPATRTPYCCLCLPSLRRRRRSADEEAPAAPPPSAAAAAGAPLHLQIEVIPSASQLPPPSQRVPRAYAENREKCARNLLKQNGHPSKVLLFPEEGWARSASSSYWTVTPFWWNRSRCKVVEIAGTRRYTTHAKMMDNGAGTLFILGSFKRMASDSDFKLHLTSNVSIADFNMGYCMTGSLERGSRENNMFQMTHFAVIRRKDYDPPN